MILPLVLILVAILAAAVVAYGTQPGWAEFQHGLQFIVWSRRLQWPLVTLALVMCVALIALVISGRRRAWWLIGLGPVLALFVHWFGGLGPAADHRRAFAVVENPKFVDVAQAAQAAGVGDEDWVVGLSFGDSAYAYPYAALFRSPVVLQSDHDRRLILLWSAYANRVLAFEASRGLKARDLEFVSMPANAPLLYNSRLGQFINGLKGQTLDGQKPAGFGNPIATSKTTWRQWRAANPSGKVMWVEPAGTGSGPLPTAPTRPIAPAYASSGPGAAQPDARDAGQSNRRRVTIVGTTRPAVVNAETLSPAPLNLQVDGRTTFAFRRAPDEPAKAFSGQIGERGTELTSRFQPKRDAKRPDVLFRDEDTGTLWNGAGVAVAGPKEFRGKRLTPVVVDDGVDWAVLKYWYPELQLYEGEPKADPKLALLLPKPATTQPVSKRRPTTQRVARRKSSAPAPSAPSSSDPSKRARAAS